MHPTQVALPWFFLMVLLHLKHFKVASPGFCHRSPQRSIKFTKSTSLARYQEQMTVNCKKALTGFGLAIILVSFLVIIIQRWLLQSEFARSFQVPRRTEVNSTIEHRERTDDQTEDAPLKVILLYTLWFGSPKWPGMATGLDANVTCGEQICKFTHKQRELQLSDAVIFHGRDLPSVSHMKNIEKRKPSKQRWVFFVLESPINTHLHFASLNGLFNWTMTYRIDSDIFFPYGYYTRSRLNPDEISSETTNYADGKDKLAVWTSSHCGTLRDNFVRKLLKYIQIDIFGTCARQFNQHEPCRKWSPECNQKLQRYKFYFAFENAFCVDYITEKYWDIPFNQNIVPVVMGGASYENEQLAIPGSFIDVANFESVEAIANYLLYLNANNTAYNEYFWWKKEFKVLSNVWDSWPCRLCHALNNSSLPAKVYNNMDDFWGRAKNCGRNEEKIRKLIAGVD